MEEIRRQLSEIGSEAGDVVRSGLPDSEADRYGETVSNGDKAAEDAWIEGIDERFDDYALVSEEGEYVVSGDPEYIFLVDPLDGSSLAASGESPYVTSTVALLDAEDVSGSKIAGEPLGSYCLQPGRGTEYFAWLEGENHASVQGRVNWTEVSFDDELPGEVDGTRMGPQDITSLTELDNSRPGIVSNYAAKDSRLDVDNLVNRPLMREGNVRVENYGGSFGGLAVGTSRNILAFEARPTKPTEAAGDIFAEAIGAQWISMTGEEIDEIEVDVQADGPRRTYSSQVTATEELAEEVREVIDLEGLYQAYPGLQDIHTAPVTGESEKVNLDD
jgi:hypothetical protein